MVALIITIILMSILVGVGINFGNGAINKARLEDIKTDMISIKTKAKIIADEYNFKDIEVLKGKLIDDQEILSKLSIEEGYLWDRNTLDEEGLNSIKENVYVVTYNLEDTSNCEVYYINGYDGKYSLTDLQN